MNAKKYTQSYKSIRCSACDKYISYEDRVFCSIGGFCGKHLCKNCSQDEAKWNEHFIKTDEGKWFCIQHAGSAKQDP